LIVFALAWAKMRDGTFLQFRRVNGAPVKVSPASFFSHSSRSFIFGDALLLAINAAK